MAKKRERSSKSKAKSDSGVADASGSSPEVTASRLIGRSPTPEEVATAEFYDSLRSILFAAREQAGLSQADLATRLNVGQSEISRLETSVGPGTGLGRIRNYLTACGADLGVAVTTEAGRVLVAGDTSKLQIFGTVEATTKLQTPLFGTARVPIRSQAGAGTPAWLKAPEAAGAGAYPAAAAAAAASWLGMPVAAASSSVLAAAAVPGAVAFVVGAIGAVRAIAGMRAFDDAVKAEQLPPEQVTRLREAYLTKLEQENAPPTDNNTPESG